MKIMLKVLAFLSTALLLLAGYGIEAQGSMPGEEYEDDGQECLVNISELGTVWASWVSIIPLLCIRAEDFSRIEFIPTGTIDIYSDVKPQDIMIPLVGASSFVDFDKDTYNIAEEDYHDFLCNEVKYSSSDQNVVLVYDGRILANGGGTAIVTIQYQDMVQCLRVTVGRKRFLKLKISEINY